MKSMQIYEPAMCCDTGLCGVGVDPELLRISTALNTLNKDGVKVERFNLTSAPQEFVTNKTVNQFLRNEGVDKLPVSMVGGEIVISGRYPTNDEFIALLELPEGLLSESQMTEETSNESEDCCCGGCCCE